MRMMATNITQHGSRNALAYLIGSCLVLGATLTGFYDNFFNLTVEDWSKLGWWQLTALAAKSLSAAPAALVGYLIKSPVQNQNPETK